MSRIAVVYALEPIFTVIFVINMNKIWEKVMSVLRAQIFRRMLIQKVALHILTHLIEIRHYDFPCYVSLPVVATN